MQVVSARAKRPKVMHTCSSTLSSDYNPLLDLSSALPVLVDTVVNIDPTLAP